MNWKQKRWLIFYCWNIITAIGVWFFNGILIRTIKIVSSIAALETITPKSSFIMSFLINVSFIFSALLYIKCIEWWAKSFSILPKRETDEEKWQRKWAKVLGEKGIK